MNRHTKVAEPGQSIQASAPSTVPAAEPSCFDAADLIVTYLEKIGVEYVFGVPGGAIEPLYNALARSARRGGPQAVVARHETGAAFMAEGYARETGKLGVCISTSGPGATNLLTGVSCAYENQIPMLVITAQPIMPSLGKRALQESGSTGVNTLNMFECCTRYNDFVSHIDQMETKLINALMSAQHSPPGPSHLSIPVDILRTNPTYTAPLADNVRRLLKAKPVLVDLQAIQQLTDELFRAQDIVVLIGANCAPAIQSIMQLVELTHALFITTPDGKGLIDPYHPAYRGVFGFGGHTLSGQLLNAPPDLVLAFGTGFSELSCAGWNPALLNKRLIHIDAHQENLMHSPMARLQVCGDLHATCAQLLQLLNSHPHYLSAKCPELSDTPTTAPTRSKEFLQNLLLDQESFHSNDKPIKPQRLMQELSNRCLPDTRFVTDIGNSMVWAIHYLHPRKQTDALHKKHPHPQTANASPWLNVTLDFAPMGWGIGCAIGLACGNRQRPVVCLVGDGAYLMCGQEITTAIQEKLPVVFVILNDSAYGMVMHGQRLAGAEAIGFDLPAVDFRMQAASLGIPGHTIHSAEDLAHLDFSAMQQHPGPTLIDVRIDREQVPPMNVRMKTLGILQ